MLHKPRLPFCKLGLPYDEVCQEKCITTQPTIICSKLTIEALEQVVKYVQN